MLRELARYAGVHIYSETEDVLYANRDFVALHTVRAGQKTIHLPQRADVWETFTDRQVGHACVDFNDIMQAGSTNLYYFGSAPKP